MRRDRFSRQNIALAVFGILPVAWLAVLIAPYIGGGLPEIVANFAAVMSNPFRLRFCADTPKTVLVCELIYGIALGVYFTTAKNYRRREEHGSAKWGSPEAVNRKYADKTVTENKILTRHVAIGLDGHIHRRNLNILVIGGSGAGKTRFYAKPNIMNANTSFVVLDPKGEILRDTGGLLAKKGYNIKVLDLIHMEKSNHYNPFKYLRGDEDIQRLTTNLIKNTTPKGSHTNDPFWDQAGAMLLKALVCYLHYFGHPDDRNFSTVMTMIRSGGVNENDPDQKSPLDYLFDRVPEEHVAKRYYRDYHAGSGKTLRSIQISLLARLEKFNLSSLAAITRDDEMEFDTWDLQEHNTALFAVIPDNDTSFNFIIGMLYTQLFQHLYMEADDAPGGRLRHHVHFIMDEFANVALPDDFGNLLATMRSREISVSIIIQNMAQLKALFEKEWENITGNCDETLFLGGNEQSTHKYVSESLGKETIDLNSYGRSKGHSGSYSTNYQIAGRELLLPDEVRKIDNDHAILFIRGEDPIWDEKYDILKHPNVRLTTDGGAEPYVHGNIPHREYDKPVFPPLTREETDALPYYHPSPVSFTVIEAVGDEDYRKIGEEMRKQFMEDFDAKHVPKKKNREE